MKQGVICSSRLSGQYLFVAKFIPCSCRTVKNRNERDEGVPFGQFRNIRKIFRDNFLCDSRFCGLPGYNIEHGKHGAVVITHQLNCSWLRCNLWKFAFTRGRGRKTTQVENIELARAKGVAFRSEGKINKESLKRPGAKPTCSSKCQWLT